MAVASSQGLSWRGRLGTIMELILPGHLYPIHTTNLQGISSPGTNISTSSIVELAPRELFPDDVQCSHPTPVSRTPLHSFSPNLRHRPIRPHRRSFPCVIRPTSGLAAILPAKSRHCLPSSTDIILGGIVLCTVFPWLHKKLFQPRQQILNQDS